MSNRWFNSAIILFWVIAMSWLLTQKVLPPMLAGDPPDYEAALSLDEESEPPAPICWRIEWEGRHIGTAASQPFVDGDQAEMRSIVRFNQLPVRNMLGQLLGSVAPLITSSLGNDEFTPNMVVATRLDFDDEKELEGFQTVIDMPEMPQFIDLDGRVSQKGKLQLVATARYGVATPGEPPPQVKYRHELDLPRDALVADSLSPRGELKGLRVGQRWTIPIYRPFPPNSPVQILLARVESSDYIQWNGEVVHTMVVVYHDEAGSGIGTARAPIGRMWVEPDGTVLRQELMLSNLKLLFERLTPGEARDVAAELSDERFHEHFRGLVRDK